MGVADEEDALTEQYGTERRGESARPRDEPAARPSCPRCGSAHTQPFTHAGPGSRVNMKCIDCGELFRESVQRR